MIKKVINKFFHTHYTWFLIQSRFVKSRSASWKKIHGATMYLPDTLSAVWQYKEIFLDLIYSLPNPSRKPVIIDCGSNIGMSLIFYANHYPEAEIYSFEADSEIFSILKKNTSHLTQNLHFFNKAVWIKNEELVFYSGDVDGGSLQKESGRSSRVEAVDLKEFLKVFKLVDFLKIDIEGSEKEIIPHIQSELHKVRNLFVEYHHWDSTPQSLSTLIKVLEEEGFKYTMDRINKTLEPIKDLASQPIVQINIFATKNF